MNISTLLLPLQHELNIEPVNRLTHCLTCQNPFKDPVTLSCGYTLCHDCIPATQFQCPSFSCLRIHDTLINKPINITLQNLLDTQSHSQIQHTLQCFICLNPFQDPITTECGHTYCKECLIQTITHHNQCPLCRHTLTRIGKVNQVISSWLQSRQHYPVPQIPVLESPPIPLNQECLFRISQQGQSVFREMVEFPYQPHYAICVSAGCEPVLLRIDHLEYSGDTRHSVVQAYSLCVVDTSIIPCL